VSAATFGHRPRIQGTYAVGGANGFRELMPLAEPSDGGVFRRATSVASASVPDTSSKAYATALNHPCDCDDWLTAIDHCTRKRLRN